MAMKKLVISLCLLFVLSLIVAPAMMAYAQSSTAKIPLTRGPLTQINEYFSTQSITYSDGTILERSTIKGPPKPPPGQMRETVSLPEPMPEMGINTLTVPAFTWVFGCSAVSAAMIAGYYDLNGFPDIYTGPTNDGEIPLVEDPSWVSWTDSAGDVYPNNPLIASHQGLDGRVTFGSIDDYWVSYLSNRSDPYITGNWTEHTWGDAVGDFMKTSQSFYGNVDGSTSFYFNNSATPLFCYVMESSGIADKDGTYGRKLFYEDRGYKVADCYTQLTDNKRRGGFSFAQYKAEIDAGRPVLLNLQGHSVVGVGYDDSSRTVYIHDTWDNSDHTMPWGGKYAGMTLWGVSIVNIQESTPSLPDLSGYWSSVSKTVSKRGIYTVSATFITTNTGLIEADNVMVNFSLSDNVIKTYTYKSITAGSSKSTTIRFTTSVDPGGNILKADIDPLDTITESDENNNIKSVNIP
jgi:YD repeat-containing protein